MASSGYSLPVRRGSTLLSSSLMRGTKPRLSCGFRGYLCTFGSTYPFLVVAQLCLPDLMIHKSGHRQEDQNVAPVNLSFIMELVGLDYNENLAFEPSGLLKEFKKDDEVINHTSGFNWTLQHFGYRRPLLAFVFADMLQRQLLMMGVGAAMQHLGYSIQL